ncbi:hypothetical protein HQ585_14250 [candidate division KSB1 bacterium]|nr:hypothetical protein [candidate division KSB1 bacterium]
MAQEQLYLQKMTEWSENSDTDNLPRVDKKLIHKSKDINNFVSRIENIELGDADYFLSQVILDGKHPYFFEHDYDHVPGLLMIETGRQIGTAIAHLYYDVDFETVFILNEMNIRFFSYTELSKPLFLKSIVRNKLIRKGKLNQMEHDGYFIQDGNEVAYMSGTWQMYNKKVIERFRKSSRNTTLSLE